MIKKISVKDAGGILNWIASDSILHITGRKRTYVKTRVIRFGKLTETETNKPL